MIVALYLISGLAISLMMLFIGYFIAKKQKENKLKSASEIAESIIEEAKREANAYKRLAELDIKEEMSKKMEHLDKQKQERLRDVIQREKNIENLRRETEKRNELLQTKTHELGQKEHTLHQRERGVNLKEEKYRTLLESENKKLEEISGMTKEQAKQRLITNMESEARYEAAQLIKKIKDEAKESANKDAKEIITYAIQKLSTDQVSEATVSVVSLPNDEMKGRIIGREGRNIRAFENITGVELIIDDTPEAVSISGFDPVRREVARMSLEKLVSDGRIHPARIEEIVSKTEKEIDTIIKETGKEITVELGIMNIHPEIIKLLGRLKYRTSYGQNVLQHSKEVSYLAAFMADELGLDRNIAKRAGLLHDIGKAVDQSYEGTHAKIGGELAKKYGENDTIVNAIWAHHEEIEPISPIAILIQASDTISGARPGARRESLEAYVKRLQNLEEIATSYEGVEKVFAMQAGREIRVIVEPNSINDSRAQELVDSIARKIEEEMKYPGQIKVTVIRELRVTEYAK
ncbi:ribonuclease Y [candidate division WOR-3 bacterium]|jgi:ribonuclease Y|nr:ribonuclease Y [candidate division WOR-3 bacterium]